MTRLSLFLLRHRHRLAEMCIASAIVALLLRLSGAAPLDLPLSADGLRGLAFVLAVLLWLIVLFGFPRR